MANSLPADLTFTNPRHAVEFDDWPSGSARVKCKFYTEHDAKRGFRVCRQTQDKHGQWCKPKTRTFTTMLAIVDGSDGRTYILEMSRYGFVSIIRSDFFNAYDSVFDTDPRHAELVGLVTSGQDAATLLYPNRGK